MPIGRPLAQPNQPFAPAVEAREAVLVADRKRRREELNHPFLNEKLPFGLMWHARARLLARHLCGDLDAYPPFLWR